MKAKDDTNIAGILEDLNLKILEYQTKILGSNSRQTLEEYLRANGIDVIDNEDGTLSATYNGINFIIDKTTYLTEVDNRPKFEVAVSEANANNKVTITVTISNASEFSAINSIKLTNTNKDAVVDEKTDGKSTATFEVDANGDYKVEVKATKNGTQNIGTKLAQVNKIPVTFATTKGTIEIVWIKDTGKTINIYNTFKYEWKSQIGDTYRQIHYYCIPASKKEKFSITCLTNEKQFYIDNYPGIVVENSSIDDIIVLTLGGNET